MTKQAKGRCPEPCASAPLALTLARPSKAPSFILVPKTPAPPTHHKHSLLLDKSN